MATVRTMLLAVGVYCCWNVSAQQPALRFDHLVFFVPDTALEHALTQALFHPAEHLTTRHRAQGTEGRYVLFLNTSIEFLYLRDSSRAEANEARFGSAYVQRWQYGTNSFAFGLIADPFDSSAAGFHVYASPDMPQNERYLMADGNTDLTQPLIYASMPHRAHKTLASLEEVERVDPAIRDDLRHYLSHPSGIRRLTGVKLTVPERVLRSGNVALLQGLDALLVQAGSQYALMLEFDEGTQGREFRWNKGMDLCITY